MGDITADDLAAMSRLVAGFLKAVPPLLGKTDVPEALAEATGLRIGIVVSGVLCVVAMKDGEPAVVVLNEVDGG